MIPSLREPVTCPPMPRPWSPRSEWIDYLALLDSLNLALGEVLDCPAGSPEEGRLLVWHATTLSRWGLSTSV